MQALRRVGRLLLAQGLAQRGGGVVPVLLPHLHVSLDDVAHSLVGPLGLDRPRRHQGLGRLALTDGQRGLGLLHGQ